MNQPLTTSWFDLIPASKVDGILQAAIKNVEQGLGKMLGHNISISTPELLSIPIHQLDSYAGDPEEETVGVYLLINGDLEGQAILLLPLARALDLLEMMLGSPVIADPLGDLETAALAEVGNLMVAYFLNTMTSRLGQPAPVYPSPPVVMVDMLGAMLNVVVTPVAMQSDQLLIVTCNLDAEQNGTTDLAESIPIHFWIMPAPPAEKSSPQAGL